MAANLFADRVIATSTTTGTSDYASLSAVTGFQGWSAFADGSTVLYTAFDADPTTGVPLGTWEVGQGVVGSSGAGLARGTIYSNSSGGTSKIAWSAGTRRVVNDVPAW